MENSCCTCGFNIYEKCRVPGGDNLTLDMIDMSSDCGDWCAKDSKEHKKALAIYDEKFPTPSKEQRLSAFGTESDNVAFYLLLPLVRVLATDTDPDALRKTFNNANTLISAIKPRDELEAMLATQMLGIHDLAMKTMVNCSSDDRLDAVNLKVNQVTKLTRTFIAQMEALNKHRGKGQQKMTIEHIHVNEGGQAVIGTVERGGG